MTPTQATDRNGREAAPRSGAIVGKGPVGGGLSPDIVRNGADVLKTIGDIIHDGRAYKLERQKLETARRQMQNAHDLEASRLKNELELAERELEARHRESLERIAALRSAAENDFAERQGKHELLKRTHDDIRAFAAQILDAILKSGDSLPADMYRDLLGLYKSNMAALDEERRTLHAELAKERDSQGKMLESLKRDALQGRPVLQAVEVGKAAPSGGASGEG